MGHAPSAPTLYSSIKHKGGEDGTVLNSNWTKRYGDAYYISEAIAWSENGNHAAIYVTGTTADEADTKLMGALRELKLMAETSRKSEAI